MSKGQESSRAAGPIASARKNKKILVVDDEKDIVETVAYNLRRHGYEVVMAYDGSDALEVAFRESPDLILPHPRARARRFVLEPLAEIAPGFIFPGQSKTVAQLLSVLDSSETLRRLPDEGKTN